MSEIEASAERADAAALAGVTASLTVFALAQGLSSPLFTFLMQRQGLSAGQIGLSAAMTPLGLVLSAAFVPAAVRVAGARRLAVGCALAAAALFVVVGLLQNWVAWLLVRFLIGFAINPLYILGEVWILALSNPERRGRLMGVFSAVTGAGYAAGPLTLTVTGSEGWAPLAVGAGGFVGCAALLFVTARGIAGFGKEGESAVGMGAVLGAAPALFCAVAVSAATQQSAYSLMPVFGAANGLPEAKLALLVTMMSLGNIVLQIPLGMLAERVGARAMIIACALATMLIALTLPAAIHTPLIWPLVLAMGGVGYGVYTMSLVELGERFSGQALVAGNAAFAMLWGLGGIIGPPGAGVAMEAAGPAGLPLVMAGLTGGLAMFLAYRSAARRRR